MYIGHAGLALLAKAARPRIPVAVLVPLAFGPDWVQWVFVTIGRQNMILSHSLVSVGFGATASAVIYFLATQARGDSVAVALTYLSHWPADFVTAVKPTWPGGPQVGLRLYSHPVADIIVESCVVGLCWLAYRRSLPPRSQRWRIGLLVPITLVAMQFGFYAIQNPAIKEPLKEVIGQ